MLKRTNSVFTAHGSTPSYKVRIGIDQGEVISPLLCVIYIDPLLTVLKNEMKHSYVLSAPTLIASQEPSLDLRINNLVFMDDYSYFLNQVWHGSNVIHHRRILSN
ncbi:unnamed protein product [Rhizophagus irregularis]|nr:unnamed protein product [Rhizophagus irregularis]